MENLASTKKQKTKVKVETKKVPPPKKVETSSSEDDSSESEEEVVNFTLALESWHVKRL